ncbi:MAG TPA: hypothetical protein VGH62_01390 [Bradyrhizobium sp.]|jgi:hypothetical protein
MSTNTVTVYPTSRAALAIKHPVNGPLSEGGAQWLRDGFTARMLSDGAVTLDKARAWHDEAPPMRTADPPQPTAADGAAETRQR